ncbi:MAG: 50S ribosomal protein L10 [Rickettsiales bacterium]|jgi:large subunit ribosomal protein L10|nr:50S ribosomal protein L10 [Rickettsiales bacterium]
MNSKEYKTKSINIANDIFSNNDVVIVMDYKGLNAKDIYSLRKLLKSKSANVKVLKNTLVKKAISDNGGSAADLLSSFKDQVAIAYSNDIISLSNALVGFIKENEKAFIKAGFMNGSLLSLDRINEMSSLGSAEDVKSKFVGLLSAPASKLARVLKAKERQQTA